MSHELYPWLSRQLEPWLTEETWRLEEDSNEQVQVVDSEGQKVTVDQHGQAEPQGGALQRLFVGQPATELGPAYLVAVPSSTSGTTLHKLIQTLFEHGQLKALKNRLRQDAARRDYEVGQLIEIGKSLSSQRDLSQLLDLVLGTARALAGADAGSIYVVEGDVEDLRQCQLRFKLSHNDSLSYASQEFTLPVTTQSIAGAAAILRKTINIPDVRDIPADAPYHYDGSWDEKTGYHTRSVLAVPMINLTGAVFGVVQLINKKRNPRRPLRHSDDVDELVIPMDARTQMLVETLASQAGVAMENALLYDEIKDIFEGFVRASVLAIEQRDPTTSGHSFRVARLTRHLAQLVDRQAEGPLAAYRFSESQLKEIETAAVLHDFGKVGVREDVLVKAKKLYPPELKIIRARFDFVRRSIEKEAIDEQLRLTQEQASEEVLHQAAGRCDAAIADLEECWRIICAANEPTVLPEGDFNRIIEIAQRTYRDLHGQGQPLLSREEVESLQIAKGSLTDDELEEIRSHVRHSISFLQQIPWGRSMRNIPLYAGAHHERLDGTGYPRGLRADEIPFPAQIMAVADIFDALTAADRPYKKAVSLERALDILRWEAKDNHVDHTLVDLFIQAKAYEELNR
jgi:HD-GYP domain-containing protein (c-di-GMP phosphodiesterase class II)